MTYISTKTYNHDVGLSVCFRQWRADSHCRFLHGYALAVRLEFEATALDHNNWVVDFGGLKSFKDWLCGNFDHKLLIAEDDPEASRLYHLAEYGLVAPVVVANTGCEAFAQMIYKYGHRWLQDNGYTPRVKMRAVEVREHGGNSAIYLET